MPNFVIIPRIGSTSRVKDILENDVWLCIGRTTPWGEEDLPPQPDVGTTELDEPVVYKKIIEKYFVQEVSEDGDYYVSGTWYKILSEAEARTAKTNLVIFTTSLTFEEIGDEITFRQVGLYSNLIPAEGYEEATFLTPDQVEDPGWLEWFSNREPINVQPEQTQIFYIVLAF